MYVFVVSECNPYIRVFLNNNINLKKLKKIFFLNKIKMKCYKKIILTIFLTTSISSLSNINIYRNHTSYKSNTREKSNP